MTYGRNVIGEQESKLLPSPKRPRLDDSKETDGISPEFAFCQCLLATSELHPVPGLPSSLLQGGKARNDVGKLKTILDSHGFRTSVVSSPRAALSVYKDSCGVIPANSFTPDDGKTWLVTLLGLHPSQDKLERFYTTSIKYVYCLSLFCHKIREACPVALKNASIADLVSGCELQCRSLGRMKTENFTSRQIIQHAHVLSGSAPRLVATLIRRVVNAEPRHRVEQLEREWGRILLWNSTLSNALVALFHKEQQCNIKDVYYNRSHRPQFHRITIYLFDPQLDYTKPPQFLFLPSVRTILQRGPEALVQEMTLLLWSHMLRHGYFATQSMKDRLSADLEEFFLSGITNGPNVPLQL